MGRWFAVKVGMFQLTVGKRQDVRGIGANRVSVNQKGFSLRLCPPTNASISVRLGICFFGPVCLFVVMRRGSEGALYL